MNAKKCDRCGKYYVSYETITVRIVRGYANVVRSMLGLELNDDEENYDLCDDCVVELKKWIHPKAADEEKAVDEPHGTE